LLTRQVQRFLIVGFTTVAIDFAVYRSLLALDTPTALAKGIGFIAGTVFAYFANRLWTFDRARGRRDVFTLFLGLYLSTLAINVGVNNGVIAILEDAEIGLLLGFLVATGTSATLNFVGMRMIVFKGKEGEDL
jgi:putative flippase GtrA